MLLICTQMWESCDSDDSVRYEENKSNFVFYYDLQFYFCEVLSKNIQLLSSLNINLNKLFTIWSI